MKKKREIKPRASSKKVVIEGQGTPNGRVDDKDSSAKPNLLADPSEGQCSQAELQCIGSQEESNGLESTQDMKSPGKRKHRVSSTPKKKQHQGTPRKKASNGTCSEQMLDCGAQNGNAVQIPNLRLEAKMKAEENARMFSGKKVHPFFSSCKAGKKLQETVDVDSWCPSEKKNKNTNLGPIHVFEKVQDNSETIEWENYIFSERSFTTSDYDGQFKCASLPGKSVKSLQFDGFVSLSPSRVSLPYIGVSQPDHVSFDSSAFEQEHRPVSSPTLLAGEPAMNCESITNVAKNWEDFGMEKAVFVCGIPDNMKNLDAELEDKFPYERMMTSYQRTDRHPENSLWTNKFFPEKAVEVCGNCDPVNFLSEWLHLWSEKGFCSSKDIIAGAESLSRGDDSDYYESDCDSEKRDEAVGLKNVLLVTGPVGSGKSAAIYACAKEQGFHVIEVNASDWRTRALVMQRFAGGMESYWVQRTVETPLDTESKCMPTSIAAVFSAKSLEGSDHEGTKVIPLSDNEDFQNFTITPGNFICESNKVASDRSETKPLILFEDVDAVLSEDHGLIATIHKLAETAKRPIILTSNSCNLILPNNMDRHELCFTKPSVKELFSHAKMICAAEKVDIQPGLVERFIGFCQGDIRKTITNLQFWCQGRKCRKDRKDRRKYGPLFYDIDAAHRLLPKILPWGYPSDLSKVVEKEISESLLTEESSKLSKVTEEEQKQNEFQDLPAWPTPENGSVKAKKEAIIRRHFSVQDGNEFSSPCSNSTGSPVAFTRRNVRRKLVTVLSSDSEGEEGTRDTIPIFGDNTLGINNNDDILFQVDNTAPSHCVANELFPVPVSEQLITFKKEISEEISERNFNPSPKPTCRRTVDLSDKIFTCGTSLSEKNNNNNNNEIFLQVDSSVPSYCAATEMCSTLAPKQHVTSIEETSEVSFNPLSDQFLNGTCKSVDMSCAPELSFVPETEINGGIFSSDDEGLLQPVESNFKSISKLETSPQVVKIFGVDIVTTHEDVGDYNNEQVDGGHRGYQVMDECSRMEFKRRANFNDKCEPSVLTESVEEMWIRLRNCHSDLRQYVTSQERDASVVTKLAYEMSDLISVTDILLGDCQPVINDTLEPSMNPPEKSHSFSWYDDHMSMTSTIAQHGICLYTKEIDSVRPDNSSVNTTALAGEMISSSTNSMALGNLIIQEREIECSELATPKSVFSLKSDLYPSVDSVIRSIVPARSYLSTRGNSLYEYTSAIGHISRSETSRLSQSNGNTGTRRLRVARNYLTTGGMMLSPDDISLLGQCCSYKKE